MNCNTTHYRANSSSVPGDPTLDALRPSALVFVKLDLWPTLAERAQVRGIPVAMLSATLSMRSGRRSVWSQWLTRQAYEGLRAVGAIDAEHATRLRAIGVRDDALQVTGDTRFDQVQERAQRADRHAPPLSWLASERPTLVAGSTWPADEAVLLPAWRALRARLPQARLLIAPHEPTPLHCAPIEAWSREAGLTLRTLSAVERDARHHEDADVLLVDRVGVLGDLYALADVAYVGGGFHSAGLHSAIEPAAFGAPVLFGPRHDMSREAGLLLAAGGAKVVTTADDLTEALMQWFAHGDARLAAGAAARATVERELGATARSVRLVESLVRR